MPMTTRGKGYGRPTMTKVSPLAALVKKKRSSKTVTVRPTKALTAAVNRIVNKKIETKYVQYRPYNTVTGQLYKTNFTQAINSSNEAYSLIPPVHIGAGDHQRIGTVISPVSLTVKGHIGIISNSPDSAFIEADIYILRHKAIKDINYQLQLGNLNDLLNSGDGTNVGYDGSWTHSTMPVNTSTYTLVKHKKIRLQKGYGDANTMFSRANPEGSACYSDMPRHRATYSIKVRMPKKLQFKNDTDLTPSNDYVFMVIGFNSPTNLDTNDSIQIIDSSATTHLYYKDA